MEYLDLTYEGPKAHVALFDNGRKEAHAYIAPATPYPNAFSRITECMAIKKAENTDYEPY